MNDFARLRYKTRFPGSQASLSCISLAIVLSIVIAIASGIHGAIAQSTYNPSFEKLPRLPEIPFDYSISPLPVYLSAVPQIGQSGLQKDRAKLNHLATLGRVLFYDKKLSKNGLISCSSCHKQTNGFDDPSRFSIGFEGLITKRSSMGLSNALFSHSQRFFWDERAENLQQQVLMPFFDPVEMGLDKPSLLNIVAQQTYYDDLFRNAYGNGEITKERIAEALSSFIATMVSVKALYDEARILVTDPELPFPLFNEQQNFGKSLFMTSPDKGGAGCISCHTTDAFIAAKNIQNNGLDLATDKDQGIGGISGNPLQTGLFKPPSLRNISVRSPYMHDGRFETLAEVIDHYSTGIKAHPNLGNSLIDKQGKPIRFNFSDKEKDALIAFLETLTDHELLNNPIFADPFNP